MNSRAEAALADTLCAYICALRALAGQPSECLNPETETEVLRTCLLDLSMAGALLADLLNGADVPSGVVVAEIHRWVAVAVRAVDLMTTGPGRVRRPS